MGRQHKRVWFTEIQINLAFKEDKVEIIFFTGTVLFILAYLVIKRARKDKAIEPWQSSMASAILKTSGL